MTIQNKSTTAQYGSGEVKPSYPEGAALRQVYDALCQAQDCIRGETPEDISDEAAREDTIDKIRDAMRAIEAMQSRCVAQNENAALSAELNKALREIVDLRMPIGAVAQTVQVPIKGALDGVTIDPGDGSTTIPLEYVLMRGFSAMGWKLPATAAGDMLEAIAVALSSTDRGGAA